MILINLIVTMINMILINLIVIMINMLINLYKILNVELERTGLGIALRQINLTSKEKETTLRAMPHFC